MHHLCTVAISALHETCISIHQHFSFDTHQVEDITSILLRPAEMGPCLILTCMTVRCPLSKDEVFLISALGPAVIPVQCYAPSGGNRCEICIQIYSGSFRVDLVGSHFMPTLRKFRYSSNTFIPMFTESPINQLCNMAGLGRIVLNSSAPRLGMGG